MKKNLFPLFVILLLAACQQESLSPDISDANQTIEHRSQSDQVNVCHNGQVIHPNTNAVPAHQAHGDAVDMDDDGYFDLPNVCSPGVDCNDGDSSINPGAEEACGDDIDNNCNGEIDEDCNSVTICGQVWMNKNLDVATYRNGDPIPKVTNGAEWAALTTGAYCYYNNDSATYAAVYGKLYNWYAVNDPRGLAPEGWHVPSNVEWTALGTCLGGDFVAGGPLKETGTAHWIAPNTGATNLTGFTCLPGGFRLPFGPPFFDIGRGASFWSSTESESWGAWGRVIYYWGGVLGTVNVNKLYGYSVRCVKD